MIRDRRFSRGGIPANEPGRVVQDADRLEALGSIGILCCVATGTAMGAALFHPPDTWAESRRLDDRSYVLDHFYVNLLALPRTLLTEQ